MEALGIDVGGVIIDRVNDNTDTSFFGDNYLRTTACPGAFEIIRRLVDERFGERVFIVSKCGSRIQRKTIEWLDHHNFFGRTGVSPNRVHFCRTRQGKAPICEELGITHFIDDRLEILGYLHSVGNQFLFKGESKEIRRFRAHLKKVSQVDSWQEIANALL